MDSQEFEKYFDIFSEDKILTMRILTHDIMQSLVNFYHKYNLDFDIVLKDNYIFLRFHKGPMFEAKIFKSSVDKETLFTYYFVLNFVIEITTKINKVLDEIEL